MAIKGESKFPADLISKIIDLRQRGTKQAEIAAIVDLPCKTVEYILSKNRVTLAPAQRRQNNSQNIIDDSLTNKVLQLRQLIPPVPLKEIANQLQISISTVKKILKSQGALLTRDAKFAAFSDITKEIEEQIVVLRIQGLSKKDIALKLGLKNVQAVARACFRRGIKMKPDQIRANQVAPSPKYVGADLRKACTNNISPLFRVTDGFLTDNKVKKPFRCLHCSGTIEVTQYDVLYGNVKSCGCVLSHYEAEAKEFLFSIGIQAAKTRKVLASGRELDLYCDQFKVAIELNGLTAHGEVANNIFARDKNHKQLFLDKWRECQDLGVRLINVFSDEWTDREDQVKAYLRSIFRQNANFLSKDQYNVQELNVYDVSKFVEQVHILGTPQLCKLAIGISQGDQIVAAMLLNRLKDDQLLLSRYCVAPNWSVEFGFGRMISFLRKRGGVASIYTMSDNRWSDGAVYGSNGFKLIGQTPPTPHYFKQNRDRPRISWRQMAKIAGGLSKVESTFASLGYDRTWDLGKKKWLLTL